MFLCEGGEGPTAAHRGVRRVCSDGSNAGLGRGRSHRSPRHEFQTIVGFSIARSRIHDHRGNFVSRELD